MRDEDIPDINNPKTMKAVLEGDKLMKEELQKEEIEEGKKPNRLQMLKKKIILIKSETE